MSNLNRHLLWLYVFAVSWDIVGLPFFGSISRAVGLAVVVLAILTTMMKGRFRKLDPVLGFAMAFCVFGVLSLLWTISYEDTVTRAFTYVQLLASAWLIRESVQTRQQTEPLMAAYCSGSFVTLTSLLNNFAAGVTTQGSRFSASGQNANTLGVLLVIGLPMAWHLILNRRGLVRIVPVVYFALTPLAILLTATRGGFLAGIVALAIVPWTLPRQSLKSYFVAGALLTVGITAPILLAPSANWDRILSISDEVMEGGRMSGRTVIWKAGLELYPQRPLLGVGAGAYEAAVEPYVRYGRINSHNTAIGLLVEEGLVGFSLFAAVLVACAWTIYHSPSPHRALWTIVMLTWLVGAMDGNFEYVKITWVLFGLVSAQSGLASAGTKTLGEEEKVTAMPVTTRFVGPPHLSPADQTPAGR